MWKALIKDNEWNNGPDLHLGNVLDGGHGGITRLLVVPEGGHVLKEQINDGSYHPLGEPFLYGEMAAGIIQAIMDAGWAAGYRPTGISGERGEIKRMEENLSDLRHIIGIKR